MYRPMAKTNDMQFLVFYSIYCVFVYIVSYTCFLLYPLKIYDELMVILIPPFAYAALYYPRYVYILTLIIGTAVAALTILTTNTNTPRSLYTLFFIFFIEFLVLEFIFRNSRTQRRLIKENTEINAKLEESNQQLKETLNKLVRVSESLPICQVCNKLRTDENAWNEFEQVLHNELNTDLVKGICEDCTNELITELTSIHEHSDVDVCRKF